MQTTLLVVLLGCVATASALTLVSPTNTDILPQNERLRNSGITSKTSSSYSSERHETVTKNGKIVKNYNDYESSGDDNNYNSNEDLSRFSSGDFHLRVGNSLSYNFKRDFNELINPVNRKTDWRWAATSFNKEHVANFGTFLRDGKSNSVDLISIPFKGWVPQDDSRVPPIANTFQAVLVHKENVTVQNGQKLSVNVKFACTTFNSENVPLTKTGQSVTKPEDDPTLASCGFGICSIDESAVTFSIVATNQGIWAVYERNPYSLFQHPERRQRAFTFFKRIGDRQSSYEIIDAKIRYDRSQGKVYFLLNNEIVYTLGDLGTLNQPIRENRAYADVYTQERQDLVRSQPEIFQVKVGLTQMPDSIDPNNVSNSPLHRVKLTTDPDYYDVKARFEDERNKQRNVQWGQGASMTLVSAEIRLSDSTLRSGRQDDGDNTEERVSRTGRRQDDDTTSEAKISRGGVRHAQDDETTSEAKASRVGRTVDGVRRAQDDNTNEEIKQTGRLSGRKNVVSNKRQDDDENSEAYKGTLHRSGRRVSQQNTDEQDDDSTEEAKAIRVGRTVDSARRAQDDDTNEEVKQTGRLSGRKNVVSNKRQDDDENSEAYKGTLHRSGRQDDDSNEEIKQTGRLTGRKNLPPHVSRNRQDDDENSEVNKPSPRRRPF